MKHPIPRFFFWLTVACCLYAASCSGLWRITKTGGPAAGGAAIGSAVGGPLGAAVGGGAGAIAGSLYGENDDLRDGSLVGEEAVGKYIIRTVQVPHTPTWVWWLVLGGLGWLTIKLLHSRYRTLIFDAVSNLLRLKPVEALKSIAKASGMKHSRDSATEGQ